jgi:hypothetical protein
MEANTVQAFTAIKQFVDALADIYDKKKGVSPLGLYRRLLTFVKADQSEKINIQKFLRGFYEFYKTNNVHLVSNNLAQIPRGTHIVYSKNAYIDIKKFIYKSHRDGDILQQIRIHLLTIQAFLETDDAKADFLLQKVSETENLSAEDTFVNNIVQKAQTAINNLDDETTNNPMAAVSGLMKSGILTDMIVGLQTQVGSGQMDPSRLLQSMQGTMAKVLNDTTPSLGDYEESVDSSNGTSSSEETGVVIEETSPDDEPGDSVCFDEDTCPLPS